MVETFVDIRDKTVQSVLPYFIQTETGGSRIGSIFLLEYEPRRDRVIGVSCAHVHDIAQRGVAHFLGEFHVPVKLQLIDVSQKHDIVTYSISPELAYRILGGKNNKIRGTFSNVYTGAPLPHYTVLGTLEFGAIAYEDKDSVIWRPNRFAYRASNLFPKDPENLYLSLELEKPMDLKKYGNDPLMVRIARRHLYTGPNAHLFSGMSGGPIVTYKFDDGTYSSVRKGDGASVVSTHVAGITKSANGSMCVGASIALVNRGTGEILESLPPLIQ